MTVATGNADLAEFYDCRFSVVAGHTLEVTQLVIRLIRVGTVANIRKLLSAQIVRSFRLCISQIPNTTVGILLAKPQNEAESWVRRDRVAVKFT